MDKKHKKIIIAGGILAVALVYLVFSNKKPKNSANKAAEDGFFDDKPSSSNKSTKPANKDNFNTTKPAAKPQPLHNLLAGTKVYCGVQNLDLQEYTWDAKAKKWKGTGKLVKSVKYGDKIGEVYARVQYNPQSQFYIVDTATFGHTFTRVWDNQIIRK